MTEEKELGMIRSVSIEIEDHGILTFWLNFDFGGAGQGFGGYNIEGEYGAEVIRKIMETVGVEKWEQIPGHEMYVLRENGGIIRGIEAPKYRGSKSFNIRLFYEEKNASVHKEGKTE